MAAKENTLAILKGFESFTREVGVLDHNDVKGVVLADELGNEIFVSVTSINPVNVPSGSGKSFNRGTTGGFVYTSDGLGVSLNLIETIRKPRIKA